MQNPLTIIFPPKCAVCGEIIPPQSGFICESCRSALPRIRAPYCRICRLELPSEFAMPECADCRAGVPYEKCFVPFSYKDGVRTAITKMKFGGRPSAFRCFAREIADEMGDFRPDFITFVPQSRKTYRERGYNQTELIARELGKLLNVPVRSALKRSERGKKQVSLSRSARIANARKLFRPKRNLRTEGTCLVVDDVITTGATMRACCALLRRMGCAHVYAAAVARTPE